LGFLSADVLAEIGILENFAMTSSILTEDHMGYKTESISRVAQDRLLR